MNIVEKKVVKHNSDLSVVSRYTFLDGHRKIIRGEEDKKKHNFVDPNSPSLLITLLMVFILTSLAIFIFYIHFSINGIFKELHIAFQS